MLGSFNKTYEEKVRLGGFLKSLNQNSWQQFSFAASSWLYEVLCRSNPFPDAVSVYELPVTWKVGRDVSGRVGLISLQLLETELVPFSKKKKKVGGRNGTLSAGGRQISRKMLLLKNLPWRVMHRAHALSSHSGSHIKVCELLMLLVSLLF